MGFGPALYGLRQYAQVDYSENPSVVFLIDSLSEGDALQLSLSGIFSESMASSDGSTKGILINLADSVAAMIDTLSVAAQVSLTDASSMPDTISTVISTALLEALSSVDSAAIAANAFRGLAEALGISDQLGPDTELVELSDFLLIKEFISLRLERSPAWAEGGTSHRGVTPHIYGSVLYAKNMYSTNIAILWRAIQADPSVPWREGSAKSRTVTPHIYGNVLYSKNMYSTNISILWRAIQKSMGPGFTNQNGNNN